MRAVRHYARLDPEVADRFELVTLWLIDRIDEAPRLFPKQELAGHADLSTTMRHMHLSPAARQQAIGLLNGPHPRGPMAPGFRRSFWRDRGDGPWRLT